MGEIDIDVKINGPIHYLEFPLLLSLKYYAIRLNLGPYFAIPVAGYDIADDEKYFVGFSSSIGLDIWMFYIGGFLDQIDAQKKAFGLNVGVNL